MSAPAGWEAVVGLEIHVQLKTRTKMFCRCETSFGDAENTHTCPVCLAFPGALPVANGKAVEWTVKLGLALGCEIAERAQFHRKNYFYPDLPKGYQISQYDVPLCGEGQLVVPGEDGDLVVGIVRAHLEEDAAKTVHVGGGTGRKIGADRSLVDFNRGGTPLLEIVSRPDIRSAEEAKRFLQLLRRTVVELGISDAEMEKGTMRCDVNVSVRPEGSDELRTRWELKNMNSFTFIGRGIEAAVREQVKLYEAGGEIQQQTYDYDADTDRLSPHRSKEEAEDYRYFPEPDLVPVAPGAALVERLRAELPELPAARIRRLEAEVGFRSAEELVATGNDWKAESLARAGTDWQTAANLAMNEYATIAFPVANAAEIVKLVAARPEMTREAWTQGVAASAMAGFSSGPFVAQRSISDTSELEELVARVIDANPQEAETYRSGKDGVIGFFVGQVMKETGGKANPKLVNELLRERLSA